MCECCKKYIFEHYRNHCPVCKQEIRGGVCLQCKERRPRRKGGIELEEKEKEKGEEAYKIFLGLYSVGYRDEIIGEMVEEYKYYSVRDISSVLGEILEKTAIREVRRKIFGKKKWRKGGERKKNREGDIIIVPLPTSRKHIRERGFDHTELILKKTGGVKITQLLGRAKDTTQVGASEAKRLKQAKEAYSFNSKYFKEETEGEFRVKEKYLEILDKPIILFDDIWTTGASMIEAAKKLKGAGFSKIYGVVLGVNRKGRKPELRRGEIE